MSGDRPGVSKHRRQVIIFLHKLKYAAHEIFWRFLNPKTHNAADIQERILEKINVVLSGNNNKTIAENDDIAAVKTARKEVYRRALNNFTSTHICALLCTKINLLWKLKIKGIHRFAFFGKPITIPAFFITSPYDKRHWTMF